ncbi:hypothetical protein FHL15_001730 [Xylaria flabelliformis]|uniref:Uncharacterized protein n=1 Tax=Xylaria flabelliformis TaxID=2512241 RepID=A0A553IB76_9PEZI|nr:hypothetical protein FHL15_001730 [Xylaria flabelliformis]
MSLAPAVSKDGFSFAGDLYVEASGQNRHRRAAISELKDHFKSGSDKDHPAHWFEAQLIHYGLQPSKTKSVARMRLFDAVNSGKLAVPSHIKKLETDLKKEWTKNEREAKKAVKPAGSTSTAAGKKRKADASNVDMVINVGGINITVSANNASSSSSAVKKTKTTTATPAKAAKDDPKKKASASKAVKDSPNPKKTAASKPAKDAPKPKASTASKAKATASTPSAFAAPSSSATTSATPVKKQTARRGGISQGPGRGSTSSTGPATDRPPRTKQTALRSGAFVARGRIPTSSASDMNYDSDEPPPPYSEYDRDDDSLEPLGLLNGRYNISSHEVTGQWGHDDLDLVLTLSGRELWGKFDLGIISGILHFNERPWESSHDRVPFTWRGEETEGQIWYGNNHHGWIKFLGDGRIEGELDYMSLDFGGDRVSGQNTRSEIDAQSMRREWDGYSEEEYERLNRARWR